MLTFNDYIEWRQRKGLHDPVTMLRMAGISPEGPHEVEVQKLVKRWKKRAASPTIEPLGTANPVPRSVER